MVDFRKIFNPSVFGLTLICFLLPFLNISCAGQKDSISGLEMVTGGKVFDQSFDPNILAILMFSLAIIGLGFALVNTRLGNIMCTAAASGGFILTFILQSAVDAELQESYIPGEWGSGYYLTLVLFLLAAGFNIYLMTVKKGLPKSPRISVPRGGKFCPQCGTRNGEDNDFCSECGSRISLGGGNMQEEIIPSYTPPVYEYEPDNNYQTNIAESYPVVDNSDATQLLQMPTFPVLKIDRNGVEEIILINKPEFIIGRNTDVVDYYEANNNNIGRTHTKIISQNDDYFIVDIDSKNGTFLNGIRLNSGEANPLKYKDQIRLANVEYTFDEA